MSPPPLQTHMDVDSQGIPVPSKNGVQVYSNNKVAEEVLSQRHKVISNSEDM